MSERRINLEEILLSYGINTSDGYVSETKLDILLDAMKEACKQSLELATENAETKFTHQWTDTVEVDKFTILRTINQVE